MVAAAAPSVLLRSCHPEAVAAVTVLSTLLAISAGRGPGSVWVFGAVLAGQLFVGWTNDLLDAELDRRQGRADKPLAVSSPRGLDQRRLVRTAAAAALVLCIPLSLASGPSAALVHLTAVGAATVYNLGLKATPLSFLPYAVAFGLAPSFITLGLPAHRLAPLWATAGGALIGFGGHFAQTLPDIARDRAQGLSGLPHRLGATGSAFMLSAGLLAAAACVTLGPSAIGPFQLLALAACAALDLAVLATALRGRHRAAFRLTLAAAALVVTALIASGGSLAST